MNLKEFFRLPFDGYISTTPVLAFESLLVGVAPGFECFLYRCVGKVAFACGCERAIQSYVQFVRLFVTVKIMSYSLEWPHSVAA